MGGFPSDKPLCETMRSFSSAAYTLVELLVALALSLLLLLGITELFSRVGGSMNDARSAMNVSANIHEVALLLRKDLARIPDSLAMKPVQIANGNDPPPSDKDGYLEIIEGPDTSDNHPFVDRSKNDNPLDVTVGDVDDIIVFMVQEHNFRGLRSADFRGLILGDDGEFTIEETEDAEIVWFVRGNTLYRRVRLVGVGKTPERALRENRLLHVFHGAPDPASLTTQFPFPLYDSRPEYSGWRYLRVPTLEETIHEDWTESQWKTTPINGNLEANPDLWEQPHFFPDLQDRWSGSLKEFVDNPRHPRAGEDVVLTNVLSFDVKVWCPETGDFVDLGTPGSVWADNDNRPDLNLNLPDFPRTRTWDSWTQEGVYAGALPPYPDKQLIDDVKNAGDNVKDLQAELANAPDNEREPWEQLLEQARDALKQAQERLERFGRLQAIQITLRCFDPASRVIKHVTVVHRFK